ncbi:MAG: hypothetical protein ACE14P_15005 [Methanotrichaceae archaeon]
MRFNNQVKVGLATVICLISQGYIFTYILKVEPNIIVSILPLILYIIYIYARSSRNWYYNKPLYWIAAIIALTIIDLLPYSLRII